MTVDSLPGLEAARAREHGAAARADRFARVLRRLPSAAVALAALACAALLAVWPTVTLLLLGLALVVVLALRAPPFALVAVVLLYGLEGVIKVGLTGELEGVGVAPEAVGATYIDFAFLVAVAGLVRQDRGRTLVAIWHNAGRGTRIALGLLAAWLVLSLLQIPLSGDLGTALAGFRMTQGYVLFVAAGAMLLARARPEHVVAALVGVLVVIAAYAAFRGVAGPSEGERLAAFGRSTTPFVPSENSVIFRNIGSFSSAIGLTSFLAPAGVFLFAVGLLVVRLRLVAWVGLALVVFALVGTHVRTSVLAVALGVVFTAVLVTAASGLTKRAKIALATASVPLLIVLVVLGALVQTTLSAGSEEVQVRSAGVLRPLSDSSLELRLERWRDALDVVATHPLGTGLGTVGRTTVDEEGAATFADNTYLKVLQEQGPLAGTVFIAGLLATLIAAAAGVARSELRRRAIGIAALAGCFAFFVLGLSSEAIEQPGKVLAWLLLGVALWSGGVPQARPAAGTTGNPRDMRNLLDSLPRWPRSRWALAPVLALVLVPVAVSRLRAPDFETTLEVLPTKPPGNAGIGVEEGSLIAGAVANPGIESTVRGWRREPGFALRRSTAEAHSGTASLVSTRGRGIPFGGAAASTRIRLPAPGRYRVQAWVRLPRGYTGRPPAIALEGFPYSSRTAARAGDVRVRGRWQLVWSEHVVDRTDPEGVLVLRSGGRPPRRGQVLHWDDVRVLSSNDPGMPAPTRVNLVSNPSFERDRSGWGDPPALTADRSEAVAHSGSASLRTTGSGQPARDTNAGYTYVVFPRAGTYRARAWLYVPRHSRAGPASVHLEGFASSRQLGQRLGDPDRRGTWQRVWTDYAISSRDLEGALVLRVFAGPRAHRSGARADRGRLVYWDDASVSAPRPEPPRDAVRPANELRFALEEPQLRFEVSLIADDDRIYDPRRASVVRSPRDDVLSFIVRVSADVPEDARRLGAPLRLALARAARRSTLRRAQASWQSLISEVGGDLPADRRKLLQRRAAVVQHMIGAQAHDAVVLPSPRRKPSAADRRRQQRAERRHRRVLARLGEHLSPRQRGRVLERAADLQRMIASQTAEYVVMPVGRVPEQRRAVDRLLETLPGPFPPRVASGAAAAAGVLCALLLGGLLVAVTALRRRASGHGG